MDQEMHDMTPSHTPHPVDGGEDTQAYEEPRRAPKNLPPLTAKQLRTLKAIRWYQLEYGVSPLQKEISKMLGLKTAQGCKTLLLALEKKGYIDRAPHKHRSMKVLVTPKEAARRLVDIPGLS